MVYVACAAVFLGEDNIICEKNKWNIIEKVDGIEYRWILYKNRVYEVAAGVFNDKYDALKCAKKIYVNLFYFLLSRGISIEDAGCGSYMKRPNRDDEDIHCFLKNEEFFFSTKDRISPWLGPGVYEVENSIDDLWAYDRKLCRVGISGFDREIGIQCIQDYHFLYSEESRPYLYVLFLAEKADSIGLEMTLLCGLLENIMEEIRKKQACKTRMLKDSAVVDEIDFLKEHVKQCSSLSSIEKETLRNNLENLKEISSRDKCRRLCEKYAKNKYGNYTTKEIVNKAYSIRSMYSHGDKPQSLLTAPERYMKYVVLDVLQGYFQALEETDLDNLLWDK